MGLAERRTWALSYLKALIVFRGPTISTLFTPRRARIGSLLSGELMPLFSIRPAGSALGSGLLEIFRVFISEHPEIRMLTKGTSPELEAMIERVLAPNCHSSRTGFLSQLSSLFRYSGLHFAARNINHGFGELGRVAGAFVGPGHRHNAEYFAVLYIQPFDIIGGCFANYGQVGITQSWTLAKCRHGGKLVRHRHKEVFLEWGAASHVLYFMCCDFPDFDHKCPSENILNPLNHL